jgi:hypothetical protein
MKNPHYAHHGLGYTPALTCESIFTAITRGKSCGMESSPKRFREQESFIHDLTFLPRIPPSPKRGEV